MYESNELDLYVCAGIGCGGDLFHTGGSITSPFYPGGSNQDLDCTWRLRVPAGLKINLLFSSKS